MGESTSEAVARVEETRARLDAEVAEFQRRVPPMVDKAKRAAATGAGAVAAGTLLIVGIRLVVRRRRAARARKASLIEAAPRILHEAREQLANRLAS